MRTHPGEIVVQAIDRGESGRFYKYVFHESAGRGHVSLVWKRSADIAATRGAVLLIHGFGQNRYTWQLSGRSFANYLAQQGFDVFNVDLGGHGRSRSLGTAYARSFEEYVEHDARAAARAALERSGHDRLFLMGHSLGGAIVYALAPRIANQVAGVVTLAGVYRFGHGQPIFKVLARLYRSAGRLADPLLYRTVPYVPVDLAGRLLLSTERWLDHPAFGRSPLAVWYPQSIEKDLLRERLTAGMDRTGFGVLRQMIEWAATQRFHGRHSGVDYAAAFARLDVPLLVISADCDRLCTPADSYPAYLESASHDKTYRKFGPNEGGHWGHIDLICGKRAPRFVWPFVGKWLEAHAPLPPKGGTAW